MNALVLLLVAVVAWAKPSLEGKPALKHPVVFVHGATMGGAVLKVGPFNFGDYFHEIPDFYEDTKTPVKVAELTTDSSIGERAAILTQYLATEFPGRKVNLICHSLGGLDARYAASVLKSPQIASITTIGTPHRGSSIADWAKAASDNGGLWYWAFRAIGYDMRGRRFLPELTTGFMENIFNKKAPDRPDVKYFSVRTHASFKNGTMSYMFWPTLKWIALKEGKMPESDGLVELDSQGWGKEIATLEMDHLAQMNHHEFRKNMKNESLELYVKVYENLLSAGL